MKKLELNDWTENTATATTKHIRTTARYTRVLKPSISQSISIRAVEQLIFFIRVIDGINSFNT